MLMTFNYMKIYETLINKTKNKGGDKNNTRIVNVKSLKEGGN